MYTSICLSNNENDREGFQTTDDAIQYVVDNHLCSMCIYDGWGSQCAAEWIIVETEKLNECETLGDIFESAGYVKEEK